MMRISRHWTTATEFLKDSTVVMKLEATVVTLAFVTNTGQVSVLIRVMIVETLCSAVSTNPATATFIATWTRFTTVFTATIIPYRVVLPGILSIHTAAAHQVHTMDAASM